MGLINKLSKLSKPKPLNNKPVIGVEYVVMAIEPDGKAASVDQAYYMGGDRWHVMGEDEPRKIPHANHFTPMVVFG